MVKDGKRMPIEIYFKSREKRPPKLAKQHFKSPKGPFDSLVHTKKTLVCQMGIHGFVFVPIKTSFVTHCESSKG